MDGQQTSFKYKYVPCKFWPILNLRKYLLLIGNPSSAGHVVFSGVKSGRPAPRGISVPNISLEVCLFLPLWLLLLLLQ